MQVTKSHRQRHVNVRGRCITCKKRHVKCDENKPTCNECARVRRVCEGYPPPKWDVRLRNNLTIRRPILPKLQLPQPAVSNTRRILRPRVHNLGDKNASIKHLNPVSKPELPIVSRSISVERFENDEVSRYFNYFYKTTARQLAGYFISDVFGHLIPQLFHQDACVEHAVLAIGALNRSVQTRSEQMKQPFSLEALENQQHLVTDPYNFAIKRFGKSIQMMKSHMELAKGNHDILKVLIFCVLTSFFEAYHVRPDTSFSHISIGTRILVDWIKGVPNAGPFALAGIRSPAPNIVPDDIIHAYVRLDRQLMSSSQFESQWKCKTEEYEALAGMPLEFSTVKEARVFWELLERLMLRARAKLQTPPGHGQSRLTLRPTGRSNDYSQEDITHISGFIYQWYAAFQGILLSRSIPDGPPSITTTVLAMRCKLMGIIFPCTFMTDETAFDKFYHEYQEIYLLAKSVLNSSAPIDNNTAEGAEFLKSFAGILSYVGITCRNRELRRRAIDLAQLCPKSLGLLGWENDVLLGIARWVREQEEFGLEDECLSVPENKRIRAFNVTFSLTKRSGPLVYQLWTGEIHEGAAFQETMVSW